MAHRICLSYAVTFLSKGAQLSHIVAPYSSLTYHRNMSSTVSIAVPGSNKKITVNTGLFIDNEFVPSADSNEFITFAWF